MEEGKQPRGQGDGVVMKDRERGMWVGVWSEEVEGGRGEKRGSEGKTGSGEREWGKRMGERWKTMGGKKGEGCGGVIGDGGGNKSARTRDRVGRRRQGGGGVGEG